MSIQLQNTMNHPSGSSGAMHEAEILLPSQKGYVNEIVIVQQLLREYKYNEVVSIVQSILFPPVAANQPIPYNPHQSAASSLYAAQVGGASSTSASFGYIYMLKLLGFAQLQCNFYQKAISTYYNLLKLTDDYETQVILLLISRSPNLRLNLSNLIIFDDEDSTNMKFLTSDTSNLFLFAPANMHRIPALLRSANNVLQVAPEILDILKEHEQSQKKAAEEDSSNAIIISDQSCEDSADASNPNTSYSNNSNGFFESESFDYFCVTVRSVLTFEYFAMGNSEMVVKILNSLVENDPQNPKYLAGLIQTHAHFGDIRAFETKIALTKNIDLGYFKSNIFFGIEALFRKNRKAFSMKFLEITRDHVPSLFLEKHKNVFTVKQLKDAHMIFRNQLIECMKVLAFEEHISHTLHFHQNLSYLDLFFD